MRPIQVFKVKQPLLIASTLILPGDILYIESYDPVAGKPQLVFRDNREQIGSITSKDYWEIIKKMEKIKTTTP